MTEIVATFFKYKGAGGWGVEENWTESSPFFPQAFAFDRMAYFLQQQQQQRQQQQQQPSSFTISHLSIYFQRGKRAKS